MPYIYKLSPTFIITMLIAHINAKLLFSYNVHFSLSFIRNSNKSNKQKWVITRYVLVVIEWLRLEVGNALNLVKTIRNSEIHLSTKMAIWFNLRD